MTEDKQHNKGDIVENYNDILADIVSVRKQEELDKREAHKRGKKAAQNERIGSLGSLPHMLKQIAAEHGGDLYIRHIDCYAGHWPEISARDNYAKQTRRLRIKGCPGTGRVVIELRDEMHRPEIRNNPLPYSAVEVNIVDAIPVVLSHIADMLVRGA